MFIKSDAVHTILSLTTSPVLVAFVGGRPKGQVGIKAKLSNLAGGNLLIIGIPNGGIPGSTSAPTMETGSVWDEAAPGQSIQGGQEYGDVSKDFWVCMTLGTGKVSIWPKVN